MSFIVYRSSAGSGKTYTLVREYLKIVLQRPDLFRNILALTFTNKAANEMKERLLQFLSGLAQKENEQSGKIRELASGLALDCHLSPEQIRERATKVLSLILHHYSDLAVGTIDSFTARVIRTFARDLHLPQGFEIELDQESLISQAVDALIQKVGKDERLTPVLLEFTLEKAEGEKGWDIERDIAKFTKNILFKDEGQIALDDFKHLSLSDFAAIRQKLFKLRKDIEDEVSASGSTLFKLLTDNGLSKETFFQGNRGIYGFLQNLSVKPLKDSWMSPNSFVVKAIEEDVWLSAKPNPVDKATFGNLEDKFKDAFRELYAFVQVSAARYLVYTSLYSNLWTLSLLHEMFGILEEIKSDNNILPIAEFNRRIAEVVLNEPIPFIYERLGERYHYFLIDEFQDTSILQWQNILPLIENALSEGYQVILVGDGKQAIYRWRGGEVEQFSTLPDIYRKPQGLMHDDREEALQRNYIEEVLGTNYRSAKVIVDFNNDFFSHAANVLNAAFQSTIYFDKLIRQLPLESKQGGMLSLEFVPESPAEISHADLMLEKVLAIILELRTDGYQWGDIAILGRSNKNIGLTAEFLVSRGIPVQSPDVLLLSRSGKVAFLISCLQWIAKPEDKIARRAMEIFLERKFHPLIESLLSTEYLKLPVYELCESLIRIFQLAVSPDPYLLFFLDAVHQYAVKNEVSVNGFLDWWQIQAKKLHLLTPEEVPAVRIMTVHKAKGLQFPVVILPFLPGALRNSNEYIWADFDDPAIPELPKVLLKSTKDLEKTRYAAQYFAEVEKSKLEYLNILYVAMTRPEERLYLLSDMPSKAFDLGFNTADMLYRFLRSCGHEDTDKVFLLGERKAKLQADSASGERVAAFQLKDSNTSPWKDKLLIRFNYPEFWDVYNPEGSRDRGTLLHKLLSKITTLEQWEAEFDQALAEGWVNPEDVTALKANVLAVISHPVLKEFFAGDSVILAEKEILLPDGKLMRPDRVVALNGRTAVLDYKTGEKSPHHTTQIRSYTRILEEMTYPGTEAYLVYLDNEVEVVNA